jgi:hypothetical protein
VSGPYRPVAWYRRTPDSFNENIRVEADVSPEDVAKTVNDVVKRVTRTHSAAVWFDNKLLAVVQYEDGNLFVRIVPTMRDYIALPWRAYGQ